MKEIKGNLWDYIGKADVICITTNGFVKSNGHAVMGRGCAKQATVRYPDVPKILGKANLNHGWRYPSYLLSDKTTEIWSYPVKPDRLPNGASPQEVVSHMRDKLNLSKSIPGWASVANLSLICFSAARLVEYANQNNWNNVIIPRPGCGAGELSWKNVSTKLNNILDDRFTAITFK